MQSGQLVVICAIFLLTFALLHGAGAANVINVAALVTYVALISLCMAVSRKGAPRS
jgi:hypothetical protein